MKKYAAIDLHVHSAHSHEEGCNISVRDILQQAQTLAEKKGKEVVISITDHNSVLGSREAQRLSSEFNMVKVISGIEFSTNTSELGMQDDDVASYAKFHMLGYNYDLNDKELIAFSKIFHKTINYKSAIMNKEKIFNFGAIAMVERKHLGERYGICMPFTHLIKYIDKSESYLELRNLFIQAAADFYQKPAKKISKNLDVMNIDIKYHNDLTDAKLLISEAAYMIKKAGGKIVIAHPHLLRHNNKHMTLNNTSSQLDIFYQKLTNVVGKVDGIEVYHYGAYDSNACSFADEIACKYNLYVTAGSDYHGPFLHSNHKLCEPFNHKFNFKAAEYLNKKDLTHYVTSLCFVDMCLDGIKSDKKYLHTIENNYKEISNNDIRNIITICANHKHKKHKEHKTEDIKYKDKTNISNSNKVTDETTPSTNSHGKTLKTFNELYEYWKADGFKSLNNDETNEKNTNKNNNDDLTL